MVSSGWMACSVVKRYQTTSALKVEATSSSKVLMPNTILRDIILEGLTMYSTCSIMYFVSVLRLDISESKWEKTLNSMGVPLCFVS